MATSSYRTCSQIGNSDDDDWWEYTHRTITVLEDDQHPIDTGLLDHHGNKLFRVEPRPPVGFHIPRNRS